VDDPVDAGPWPVLAAPPPGHGTPAERRWAVALHLSLFLGLVVVPLAVVLWQEGRSPYLCHHAAEALNFHGTVVLALLAVSMTTTVLVGALLLPVVLAAAAALAVRGALHSRRGAWHRYPLTLRLVD